VTMPMTIIVITTIVKTNKPSLRPLRPPGRFQAPRLASRKRLNGNEAMEQAQFVVKPLPS
jgi:hypothetical protein